MKKIGILLCFVLLILLCSCSKTKTIEEALLATPKEARTLSTEEIKDEGFQNFLKKVNAFSYRLTDVLLTDKENQAISPISIYFALAMAVECVEERELSGLLSALNMSYEEVLNYTSTLFHYLTTEKVVNDTTICQLQLSNSIWLNQGLEYNKSVVDSLTDNYYCYPYQVDFKNRNKEANQLIQDFINERTKGLINQSFDLSTETLVALINTLYFADNWYTDGTELSLSDDILLTNLNGESHYGKLLMGAYQGGIVAEEEQYEHFYMRTANGYQMRLILPKEGYSIKDIYTASTLKRVVQTKYTYVGSNPKERHITRCLVPSFEAQYDEFITEQILDLCSLKTLPLDKLLPANPVSSSIQHVTKLKLDRKGIKGAAVTILSAPTSAPPEEVKIIAHDFILNRPFGFILSTPNGVPLFTGMITQL